MAQVEQNREENQMEQERQNGEIQQPKSPEQADIPTDDIHRHVKRVENIADGRLQSGNKGQLIKPPVFNNASSVSNPTSWIDKYDIYAQFSKWQDSEKCTFLKIFLGSNAEVWYDDLPVDISSNWKSLKSAFIDKFANQTPRWAREEALLDRFQQVNENVEDYINDINMQCSKLEITPNEKLRIFVRGLKSNIKKFVVARNPNSMQLAEQYAILGELVDNIKPVTQKLSSENAMVNESKLLEIIQQQQSVLASLSTEVSILKQNINKPESRIAYTSNDDQLSGFAVYCQCNRGCHSSPAGIYPKVSMSTNAKDVFYNDQSHSALSCNSTSKVQTRSAGRNSWQEGHNHSSNHHNIQNQGSKGHFKYRRGHVSNGVYSRLALAGQHKNQNIQTQNKQRMRKSNSVKKPIQISTCAPILTSQIFRDNLINVSFAGHDFRALVDTGAQICAINYNVLKRFPELVTQIQNSSVKKCVTANGDSLQIIGEIYTTIDIADRTAQIKLQVIDNLDHDIIIGVDFLSAYEVTIDFKSKKIQCPIPEQSTLFADRDIVIPPKSEVACLVKTRDKFPNGVIGECSRINLKLPVVVASSVSCLQNDRVPIKIMNITENEKIIYKSTKLGKFTCLTSDTELVSLSAGQNKQINNSKQERDHMSNRCSKNTRSYQKGKTTQSEPVYRTLNNDGNNSSSNSKWLKSKINHTQNQNTKYFTHKQGKYTNCSTSNSTWRCGQMNNINTTTGKPQNNNPYKFNFTKTELNEEEKCQLLEVLDRHKGAFLGPDGKVGFTDIIEHTIPLMPGSKPYKQRPYRVSPDKRHEISRQVKDMLDQDIIEPSTSMWGAPVILVKKPSTKPNEPQQFRFCVDWRKLNAQTVETSFPMPLINEYIESIGSQAPQYFTSIDLANAYHQQSLAKEDREKTAFVTHEGSFQMKRTGMGLRGSAASFQRLMTSVLQNLNWTCALVYLDDIVVHSPTFDLHLQHIDAVLSRIQDAGLKIKGSKCQWAQKELKYLGHIIDRSGSSPDPAKVECVKNYPTPKNVKQIRQFLGVSGFYRRYIKGYSTHSRPLTMLTQKDTPFVWGMDQQKAFQYLKDTLCSKTVLAYPNFEAPFTLTTDASKQGIGACLSQNIQGEEKIIAYAGRSLSAAEKNYCTTDLEGLAVVWSIKYWRQYLENSKFTIITDHESLKWFFNQKQLIGSRRARWSLYLQNFNFEIKYRPGRINGLADGLSRREYPPPSDQVLQQQVDEELRMFPMDVNIQQGNTTKGSRSKMGQIKPDTPPMRSIRTRAPQVPLNEAKTSDSRQTEESLDVHEDQGKEMKDILSPQLQSNLRRVAKLQREDAFCTNIIKYIEDDLLPNDTKQARRILLTSADFIMQRGVLYHWHQDNSRKQAKMIQQLVLPLTLVDMALTSMHDDVEGGHFGLQRTLARIKERFYWPFMNKTVDNWIKSCVSCNGRKPGTRGTGKLLPMPIPDAIFCMCAIDVLGPLTTSSQGNKYIVSFTDHLSKYCVALPSANQSAETIAQLLFDRVFCIFGVPMSLLSDQGQNFLSNLVSQLCLMFNCQRKRTSSYHPACNGQVEVRNKVLCNMMAMYVDKQQKNWDLALPAICQAYNSSEHASTNQIPAVMMFGRLPRMVIDTNYIIPDNVSNDVQQHLARIMKNVADAEQSAKDALTQQKQQMKEYYDKKNENKRSDFACGDIVYLHVPRVTPGLSKKLAFSYHGPYIIYEMSNKNLNARLRRLSDGVPMKNKIHINRLKRVAERIIRPQDDEEDEEIDDNFEVDINDLPQDSFLMEEPAPGNSSNCDEDKDKNMNNDSSKRSKTKQKSSQKKTCTTKHTKKSTKLRSPVSSESDTELSEPESDDQFFEIEKILKGKFDSKGNRWYFVSWRNYPEDENSWVKYEDLTPDLQTHVNKNTIQMSGKPKSLSRKRN